MAKKNGATARATPTPAISTEPEISGIVISDEERTKLAALEAEALRYKVALADLDVQLGQFEVKRAEVREKVAETSKAYVDAVVAAAGTHGIDLNDKSARWNFDTSKMTFTRQA